MPASSEMTTLMLLYRACSVVSSKPVVSALTWLAYCLVQVKSGALSLTPGLT